MRQRGVQFDWGLQSGIVSLVIKGVREDFPCEVPDGFTVESLTRLYTSFDTGECNGVCSAIWETYSTKAASGGEAGGVVMQDTMSAFVKSKADVFIGNGYDMLLGLSGEDRGFLAHLAWCIREGIPHAEDELCEVMGRYGFNRVFSSVYVEVGAYNDLLKEFIISMARSENPATDIPEEVLTLSGYANDWIMNDKNPKIATAWGAVYHMGNYINRWEWGKLAMLRGFVVQMGPEWYYHKSSPADSKAIRDNLGIGFGPKYTNGADIVEKYGMVRQQSPDPFYFIREWV